MSKRVENIIITGLLCVAIFFAVFYGVDFHDYSADSTKVKVAYGVTLWEIAEHYIDKQDKYRTMDEFVTAIRQANPERQYHRAGAVVIIPLPKRIN